MVNVTVEDLLGLVNRDIPGWEDPIIAEMHEIRRQLRAEREADPEAFERRRRLLRDEHARGREERDE